MVKMISECPICGKKMQVTKLSCKHCHIDVTGVFDLGMIASLTEDELNFMINFVKTSGNIKEMEKIYKLSYPTIKKNLDALIIKLGGKNVSKDDILERVKNKEISVDEAVELLKK